MESKESNVLLDVFVYGTLKPGEINYQPYCEGKVIKAIPAYTWGQLFHLPHLGYPGMTIGSDRVQGVLLTFRENVLENLDRLETYQPGRSPLDNEYNRYQVPIYSLADQMLGEAWAYFMSQEKVKALGGILIPEGLWHRHFNGLIGSV